MNRTTLGYILMTVCSVALIWVILRVGSRLKAPPDFSGTWQVAEPAIPPQTARVDQSGVFVHLKVGDQPAKAYRLEVRGEEYWLHGDGRSRQAVLTTDKAVGTSLVIADTDGQPPISLWRAAGSPASAKRDGTAH